MARPRLEATKKLSRRFIFRITEDEFKRLSSISRACGKAAGTVVREKLFDGKYPEAKMAKLDLAIFLELRKIGVNLNQLTRKANAGFMPSGLTTVLSELKKQQQFVINQLLHDSRSANR